jgi:hypothetical protein
VSVIAAAFDHRDHDQHAKSRRKSAGCEPLPDVAVDFAPRLSVTVSVTESG